MLAADLPQTRLIALFRPKNAPVLLINTGNRDILTNCIHFGASESGSSSR